MRQLLQYMKKTLLGKAYENTLDSISSSAILYIWLGLFHSVTNPLSLPCELPGCSDAFAGPAGTCQTAVTLPQIFSRVDPSCRPFSSPPFPSPSSPPPHPWCDIFFMTVCLRTALAAASVKAYKESVTASGQSSLCKLHQLWMKHPRERIRT